MKTKAVVLEDEEWNLILECIGHEWEADEDRGRRRDLSRLQDKVKAILDSQIDAPKPS